MKHDTKVKIEKLEAALLPHYRTANNEEYIPGQYNKGLSPPVGYTIEGFLFTDIEKWRTH